MTLRSARRAAREAYHRMAHLDTWGALPDHAPERCDIATTRGPNARPLDIDPTRLDALMSAVAPILRRDGVQEHARRYGRRTVQFTATEVRTLQSALVALEMEHEGAEDEYGRVPRDVATERAAARRVVAKLKALGS